MHTGKPVSRCLCSVTDLPGTRISQSTAVNPCRITALYDVVGDDDDDCGYKLSLEHIKVAREVTAGLQGRLGGVGDG